jgi:very-short-patch-repair endonuclease
MKFKTLDGKDRTLKNIKSSIIKWEGKSRSKFQLQVKQFLKKYWQGDVVFEELKIVGTRLSLDFFNANKKVAIEVQGQQHFTYVPFFHGNRANYLSQIKRDVKKFEFCELNKINLVEIYPKDELSKEFFERFGVFL